MFNAGVVGFGNLGKSVAKQLKCSTDFNLVGIFSRRAISETIPYDEILKYKDKIDILFLCGGSQSDIEEQASFLSNHFNIIDSYDNHNRLKSHIAHINTIAKTNEKVALCSLGWDPGLFSLMRGLFSSLGFQPYTFWGKGTSQGHTQAIKKIDGVIDAIQFTIPNESISEKIKSGEDVTEKDKFHIRECFVVCQQGEEESIKEKIVNMPDYFKNQRTIVNFVDLNMLEKLKSFSHKGEITTKNNILNFSLSLPSNPDFTATVMINFAKCFKHLIKEKSFGAFTIFDLPLKYILNNNYFSFL